MHPHATPAPAFVSSERGHDRWVLKSNAEGSLTMYLQTDSPGKDNQWNWLPAPAGEFNLTMRIYWPKQWRLDGTCMPSEVRWVKW